MKRQLTNPVFWLLPVSLLWLTAQCLISTPPAQAQDAAGRGRGSCDELSARGEGVATAADTFVVNAEFYLKGRRFGGAFGTRVLQIKSTTRLLTQNPPTADGVINAITSHVFEVKGESDEDGVCEPGEDCLVTLDRAALIPTKTPGLMQLRSVLAFSAGQGRFEQACGKIDGTTGEAEINFAATPPTVSWRFRDGWLCECR